MKDYYKRANDWLDSNPDAFQVSYVDVDLDSFAKLIPDAFDSIRKGIQGLADENAQEQKVLVVENDKVVYQSEPVQLESIQLREPLKEEALVNLTRKLIEIRNLLKTLDSQPQAINMPSIVVIGSQSSGKSSVLEAIVGHEFLPKGSNMVTRRPIELTLINTPGAKEHCEFPQLGSGKISDFKTVQKTLTDLNLSVPEEECVSDKPIELRIYSPHVPDLTLVDLPGYIQVANRNQPAMLKEKIAELCQKYIQEPNIVLAVCSADVDLANSEALRASRKVDPLGLRTIGVVTKMDLVEPNYGMDILTNKDYPLALGYIGVVNSKSTDLIKRGQDYFSQHKEYPQSMVGTATLRSRLESVLESHMSRSMHSIQDAVELELNEARYQYKVHYNDVRISPESYASETMDILKQRFKHFKQEFGRPQVREQIKRMLEKRLVEICDNLYWKDERLNALPTEGLKDLYWANKLEFSSGSLTKSGVGRAAVQLVVDLITERMDHLVKTEPWNYHEKAASQVLEFSNNILRQKFHLAVDQVENTIKPYKIEIECTDKEWKDAQTNATELLTQHLKDTEDGLRQIKQQVGRKRLRQAVKRLNKVEPGDEFDKQTQALFDKAKKALELQGHIKTISSRLTAVKSRQCATFDNRSCCPEVYLSAVTEKLAYTAVMFLSIELLNDFFFQLPREMDEQLFYGLSKNEIIAFAKENPQIKKHLEVQEKKRVLEEALQRLRELRR
ncbi:P-loop containing nucleoside triphosphate hydrolase protein [Gorgonomyces haynaldii]|nr:P-loop containing nucleoside triphosphate hydrolase protein [Gorgonomyces haynaldii]